MKLYNTIISPVSCGETYCVLSAVKKSILFLFDIISICCFFRRFYYISFCFLFSFSNLSTVEKFKNKKTDPTLIADELFPI